MGSQYGLKSILYQMAPTDKGSLYPRLLKNGKETVLSNCRFMFFGCLPLNFWNIFVLELKLKWAHSGVLCDQKYCQKLNSAKNDAFWQKINHFTLISLAKNTLADNRQTSFRRFFIVTIHKKSG